MKKNQLVQMHSVNSLIKTSNSDKQKLDKMSSQMLYRYTETNADSLNC